MSLLIANDQLKRENNVENDQEAESENKKLKAVIQSNKEEHEVIVTDMNAANHNLKVQIENFQKCDECAEKFEEKALMKTHILSKHFERKVECDNCSNNSNAKSDMKEHVIEEHSKKTRRDLLYKKYDELVSTIANQRDNIYKDLYKLKQKEVKENNNCHCRGRFCKINHSNSDGQPPNLQPYLKCSPHPCFLAVQKKCLMNIS